MTALLILLLVIPLTLSSTLKNKQAGHFTQRSVNYSEAAAAAALMLQQPTGSSIYTVDIDIFIYVYGSEGLNYL